MFQSKRYQQIFSQHQLGRVESLWDKHMAWFGRPDHRHYGWSVVGQLTLITYSGTLNTFRKKHKAMDEQRIANKDGAILMTKLLLETVANAVCDFHTTGLARRALYFLLQYFRTKRLSKLLRLLCRSILRQSIRR